MPIPEKTYFTFAEVAERWNLTEDHINQFVWVQHRFRPVIRLKGLKAFTGNSKDGWHVESSDIRLLYLGTDSDIVDKYSIDHVYLSSPFPSDEQKALRHAEIKKTMPAGTHLVVLGNSTEAVTQTQDEHVLSKFMEDRLGNTLIWDAWLMNPDYRKVGTIFIGMPFSLSIDEIQKFEQTSPLLTRQPKKRTKRNSKTADLWKEEIEKQFLRDISDYTLAKALDYIRSQLSNKNSVFDDMEEDGIEDPEQFLIYLREKPMAIKGKTIDTFLSSLRTKHKPL